MWNDNATDRFLHKSPLLFLSWLDNKSTTDFKWVYVEHYYSQYIKLQTLTLSDAATQYGWWEKEIAWNVHEFIFHRDMR